MTNWAWSVSRNIDRLTLDEDEQVYTEGARRVQLDGFTDGLVQGLSGFGIRLLGMHHLFCLLRNIKWLPFFTFYFFSNCHHRAMLACMYYVCSLFSVY